MGMTIYRWHNGPFISAVNFVDEQWETGAISVEEGQTLQLPKSGFDAQVCQIEGVPKLSGGSGWGSQQLGGRNVRYLRKEVEPGSTGIEESLVFLSVRPSQFEVTHTFTATLVDGKTLGCSYSKLGDTMMVLHVKTTPENLVAIDVKLSTPLKRAVFRFPEFPGMPEANHGISDLFAAEIPYLDSGSNRYLDMERFLSRSAQVKFDSLIRGTYSSRAKPTTIYENAPLGEILFDYQMFRRGPTRLHTDTTTYELVYKRPWFEQWWEQLRKRFP